VGNTVTKKKKSKSRKKKATGRVGVAPITEVMGFSVLGKKHPDVAEYLEDDAPEIHGEKVWTSSWLLLDYLERIRMPRRTRVLEVGCGWGIASNYCAKVRGAVVTALDADRCVFPILDLQAAANGVRIKTIQHKFDQIPVAVLKKIDVLVGADICFWDELIEPLLAMIRRALRAGVKRIILADPGRPCFEELAAICEEEFRALMIDTDTKKPVKSEGSLLVVEEMRG